MGNPVVHFEIRAEDPDAAREFYGKLFGWTYPAGRNTGLHVRRDRRSRRDSWRDRADAGRRRLVTVFVGVEDVEATLRRRNGWEAGSSSRPPGPGVTFGMFADTAGHIVGVAAQE